TLLTLEARRALTHRTSHRIGEDHPGRLVQGGDLLLAEAVGQREWRQLRAVQDLVGVGVADASEDLLVGEHALDLSAPEADPLSEGGRVDGEGVRPQPRHARDDGWVTDQVDGEAL